MEVFFFVGTALVIVVSKPHNTEIAAKIGLISFALKTVFYSDQQGPVSQKPAVAVRTLEP